MSQIIKLKTSSIPAKVPTTGDLILGEVAVNTNDGKMYMKKDDGSQSIIEVGKEVTPSVLAAMTDLHFESVADALSAVNSENLPLGSVLSVFDYYGGAASNGSGVLIFKVVPAGTGTADGGKYIDVAGGVYQLEQNLIKPFRVESWGARPTVSFNSAPNVQSCIDYAKTVGGGKVTGSGEFAITAIDVPNGVTVDGNNLSLRLRPYSSVPDLISISGGNSGVVGCTISGNSLCDNAVVVNKPASDDNLPVTVSGNFSTNTNESFLKWNFGDRLLCDDNFLINSGVGVNVVDDCRNTKITGNYILGASGFIFNKNLQGAEGVLITANVVLPASGGTYCLTLNCGLEISVVGNVFDQVINGESVVIDSRNASIDLVKLSNNWHGRQGGASGANYGVYMVGDMTGVVIDSDSFVGWQEAGICHIPLGTLQGAVIRSCIFYEQDPCLRDIQMDNASVMIDNCYFSGTASVVEGSGVSGRVINSDFSKSNVPNLSAGLKYGDQLAGITLRNKGAVVMPASHTGLLAIPHGLSDRPAESEVNITLTNFGGADYWPVVVHSTTTSVINVQPRVAPAVDVAIAWKADIRE